MGYARPGGIHTGVVEFAPAHGKRLELLLDTVTAVRRVAVLVETSSGSSALDEALAQFRAARPAVDLVVMRVSRTEGQAGISSRIRAAGVHAAYVPLEGEIDAVADAVFAALRAERIPTISEARRDIGRGAIMSLEVDRDDVVQRLSHQLALVLLGADPARVPVQSPRKFMLTLNLDAAAELGVRVPRTILRRAEVIVANGR